MWKAPHFINKHVVRFLMNLLKKAGMVNPPVRWGDTINFLCCWLVSRTVCSPAPGTMRMMIQIRSVSPSTEGRFVLYMPTPRFLTPLPSYITGADIYNAQSWDCSAFCLRIPMYSISCSPDVRLAGCESAIGHDVISYFSTAAAAAAFYR